MSKEPNGVLVMTTCKCRENTKNLVMTRTYFNEMLENKIAWGAKQERERLLKILFDNEIIRRCGVTNKLVAFQSDGEHVVYISELEQGEN
jgi:hypothetical protein